MHSGSSHILTVICDRTDPTAVGSLDAWVQQAHPATLRLRERSPQRCVSTIALPQRSQSRQARDEVVAHWAKLVDLANTLGLECVGVISTPQVPHATAIEWSRCALHTELLWTRPAIESMDADASAAWEHRDEITVECEHGLVELTATTVTLGGAHPRDLDSPVVGRRRERRVLQRALEEMADGRSPVQPFLLVGTAGIGKSTIMAEASRLAIELGMRVVRTHCVDYLQLRRQQPIGRFVFGLLRLADAPHAPEHLRASARRICAAVDQATSTPILLDCLDLPLQDDERTYLSRFTSAGLRDARASLLMNCVRAASEEHPVLLTFEDLHWASDELLHLLQSFVEMSSTHPMMVLGTARPDRRLFAERTGLKQAFIPISLGPLQSHEARALAMRLTEQRRKPWQLQSDEFLHEDAIDQYLLRAGGNPLHLSQMLRLRPQQVSPLNATQSLDELLILRTEQIAQEERSVLEVAACIGFYFDEAQSLELSEASSSALQALENANLITRSADGYRFVHALIRDATLRSLPKPRQVAIQLALAERETDAAIRAERWAVAGDPRAFEAFMEVSALRRHDYQWFPALAALERAAAVADGAEQRARAGLSQGEICEEQGEGLRSLNCFQEVLKSLREEGHCDTSPLSLRARLGILAAHRLLGRLDEAEACIHSLRRHLDSPDVRTRTPLACARLDYLRGAIAFSRGQLSLCRSAHRSALRTIEGSAQELSEQRVYAQALSGIGDALYAQGAFSEARSAMGLCVGLAREHGLGRIEVSTLHMLGIVTAYAGDPKAGHRLAQTSWEQACEVGDARAMLFSELNVGLTLFWDGGARQAQEACYGGTERAEWIGSSVLMGMTRSFTGHIRLAGGDLARALEDSSVALEHLQQGGGRLYGGVCYGLALAIAALDPRTVAAPRTTRWFEAGCTLLASSVISHNYLYFALGAVPLATARGDVDALWRVLNLLRDFFDNELSACPQGSVAALVSWVHLHIDAMEGRRVTADSARWRKVARQPMLRARLDRLRELR